MEYQPPTTLLKTIGDYMREPLPRTKSELIDHLTGLESHRFELAETTTKWFKDLQEKRSQMLHPKDKDYTELDRKTMLHASTALVERDYELLVRLEGLVAERIQLGKLLLTLLNK